MNQEAVPRWAAKMGINLNDYRVAVVNDVANRVALRSRNDVVAFYWAHFEVGLWLPLDPFICEFLESTGTAPLDINLHTINLPVFFAIVFRALGFEPHLPVFLHFFQVQKAVVKARELLNDCSRSGGPQLFMDPPNKVQSWNEHYIMIEAHHGWNFPVPHSESGRRV